MKEHRRMLDALDTRDAAVLRALLQARLTSKRDSVLELLRAGVVYPRQG